MVEAGCATCRPVQGFLRRLARTRWELLPDAAFYGFIVFDSRKRRVKGIPVTLRGLARAVMRLPQQRLLRPALSLFRPGNIAMFHWGRSGSKVLGDLLNQHPRMHWEGEIFQNSSATWRALLEKKDPGRRLKAARHLRAHMRQAGRSFYGVELHFSQLRWIGMTLEEYVALVRRYGFGRFVILQRRNQLRALVSDLVAEASGRWHRTGPGKVELTRIRIDVDRVRPQKPPETLPEFFARRQVRFDALRGLLAGEPILSLTYEDDIEKNPIAAYIRMCRFLGLEPTPVTVNLRRTTPFPLEEVIENFNEVTDALHGTPFAWMTREAFSGGEEKIADASGRPA